jgi:hypothetical protein
VLRQLHRLANNHGSYATFSDASNALQMVLQQLHPMFKAAPSKPP